MPHQSSMSPEMRTCIEGCQECSAACKETVQHCLHMGGKHAEQEHIATLLTCAASCAASATAMQLGSRLHVHLCRACAEICRACEHDCRQLANGDATMLSCADMCAECARSCERMAAAHR